MGNKESSSKPKDEEDARKDNGKQEPSDPNSTNPSVAKPVSETESLEASRTDVANEHEGLEKTAADSDVADKPEQQSLQVSEIANDNENSKDLVVDTEVLSQGMAGQNPEATETVNADGESNETGSNSNLSGLDFEEPLKGRKLITKKGFATKKSDLLFKLVVVIQEETESGICNKPILQQEEVIRLCHEIAPKKVKAKTRPSQLKLSELSEFELKIIGLYGDDEEIVHFLYDEHGFPENIFCLTENRAEYKRGLYGLFAKPNFLFVVFLQRQIPSDLGKDKAPVRFLRYMRELCTQIYVILKPKQLRQLVVDCSVRSKDGDDECDDESDNEEPYTVTIGDQKAGNKLSAEISLQKSFTVDLANMIHSKESQSILTSTGSQGYAFFDKKRRLAFRLEPARTEGSYDVSNSLEQSQVVPHSKLETTAKEILCLNFVTTAENRRILAVMRGKQKGSYHVQVLVGTTIGHPQVIRSFSKCDPGPFAFCKELLSWYDKSMKTVYVFVLSTSDKTLDEKVTIPLPDSFQQVELLEFLDEDRMILVASSNKCVVLNLVIKEPLFEFAIKPGLLSLCSISSTEILSVHAETSSLQVHIAVIEQSAVNWGSSLTLEEIKDLELTTVRLVQIHGQWHVIALNLKQRQLVSWKLNFDQMEEAQEAEKSRNEIIMIKRFEDIFSDYSVCHCYEDEAKPLCLSFPVSEARESVKLSLEVAVKSVIDNGLKRVKNELSKAVDKLKVLVNVFSKGLVQSHLNDIAHVSLADWIRRLVPTVPIQIARIEEGKLVPLPTENFRRTKSTSVPSQPSEIVRNLSFGLAESIFFDAAAKNLSIKVVSAQGKQNMGKSYFLNHLAGAHFDTSGWRCTEGIWMCPKQIPEFLLVLLDFEGKDTPNRSATEDCLLASFGAALSSVLVMKNDIRFDSGDIDFLGSTLREAATRVSESSNESNSLYNATLCIVLKDVARDDRECVGEVEGKIRANMGHLFRNTDQQKCFFTTPKWSCKLRRGIFENCVVTVQRPLTNKKFWRTIEEVKKILDAKQPFSMSHAQMLLTMKSMLATLHCTGVVNTDDISYLAMEDYLDKHMPCVIQWGALEVIEGSVSRQLTTFDLAQEVMDEIHDKTRLGLYDAGLHLCDWEKTSGEEVSGNVLVVGQECYDILLKRFRDKAKVKGRKKDDIEWLEHFQSFLSSVINYRVHRVEKWIKLILPANNLLKENLMAKKSRFLERCHVEYFGPLKKAWRLCRSQCSKKTAIDIQCYRMCIKLADMCTSQKHDCLEKSHLCEEPCHYCMRARECDPDHPEQCGIGAGHRGIHECRKTAHFCSQPCRYLDISRGCNQYCDLSIQKKHDCHQCSATHLCIETCSASNCKSFCSLPHEHRYNGEGKEHYCQKQGCLENCIVPGCVKTCESIDHYHSLTDDARHHCYRRRHECKESPCSTVPGRCSSKTPSQRLPCALIIEGLDAKHPGLHYCGTEHFCDQQCCCGCLEYCGVRLERSKSSGQYSVAFMNHDGPCKTSKHTFSNRGEPAFKNILERLDQLVIKAVQSGALAKDGEKVTEHLSSFTDSSLIVSDPVDKDVPNLSFPDSGLVLCEWTSEGEETPQMKGSASLMIPLLDYFQKISQLQRMGNENEWIEQLQQFLEQMTERRIQRVVQWVEINFPDRRRISQKLTVALDKRLEHYKTRFFIPMKNLWTLCRASCRQKTGNSQQCQRICIALKSLCCKTGCSNCNCGEKKHNCEEECDICKQSKVQSPKKCSLGAEHGAGVPHKCNASRHECPQRCEKYSARNCLQVCNVDFETDHSRHLCGIGSDHKCRSNCSANCGQLCNLEYQHDRSKSDLRHHCGTKRCCKICSVPGCQQNCEEDHLHYVDKEDVQHFCNAREHNCVANVCCVKGGRCSKDPSSISTPSPCAVPIPSKQLAHRGGHSCQETHYCIEKCPCCNEFCTKKLLPASNRTFLEFQAHRGFCRTDEHNFSGRPMTDLDSVLNDLEVSLREVALKEMADVHGPSHEDSESVASLRPKSKCSTKTSTTVKFQICDVIDGRLIVTAKVAYNVVMLFKTLVRRQTVPETEWKNRLQKFIKGSVRDRIRSIQAYCDRQLPKEECIACEDTKCRIESFRKKRIYQQLFEPIRQQWQLCSRFCSKTEPGCDKCERRCVLPKQHLDDGPTRQECTCLENDHRCDEKCAKCLQSLGLKTVTNELRLRCRHGSRHEQGKHNCGREEHPCPEACSLSKARGCNGKCTRTLEDDHDRHICNAGENHRCPSWCSAQATGCRKLCDLEYNHPYKRVAHHSCGAKKCFEPCSVKGCFRECSNTDHFHALRSKTSHDCGSTHKCSQPCGITVGRCPEGFVGEQAICTLFPYNHSGPHYCGSNHLCSNRCPSCDAVCTKALVMIQSGSSLIFQEHDGLCQTSTHGRAKSLRIVNSKGYTESNCMGEWCHHVCNKLGRGHRHIIECKGGIQCSGRHFIEAGRGKDELSHSDFWKTIARFEDPCTDVQMQNLFDRCPAYCSCQGTLAKSSSSYCDLKLFHQPLTDVGQMHGNVCDGHHFSCRHEKHIVLIIDGSYSMDAVIEDAKKSRLNLVKESTTSFLSELRRKSRQYTVSLISFASDAHVLIDRKNIDIACREIFKSWAVENRRETNYLPALYKADDVISRGEKLSLTENPAIFFLSDGGTHSEDKEKIVRVVDELVRNYNATFSTCIFGGDSTEAEELMKKMARPGPEQFHLAPGGQELKRTLDNFKACISNYKAVTGY